MAAPEGLDYILDDVLDTRFRITDMQVEIANLQMREPMPLPFGLIAERPSAWLWMRADIGPNDLFTHAYGEGATLPESFFTEDSGRNILDNVSMLIRPYADYRERNVRSVITHIWNRSFPDGKRYPTARLCAEMALLDLGCKAQNISVRDAIGVSPSIEDVPYGKSIASSTVAGLMTQTEEAVDRKAQKIKIKVSPTTTAMVLQATKEMNTAHPDVAVMIDANGTFDPTNLEDVARIKQLDVQGYLMFEEPVSRSGAIHGLDAIRTLRSVAPDLQTPLCLDDCLATAQDCRTAIDEGLAQIVNVKPGRIGSFLQSLALARYAKKQNAEVMVGGMLEATPGRCMTLALGAYCLQLGFTIPGDLSLAQERLMTDLVPDDRQLAINDRGNIVLPTGPGWGF